VVWRRLADPLWGVPRIHGELLKLGIDVGQTSVAKYMARHRRPPSQGWKTFLRNHANGIASIDLFVVPKLAFRRLYGLLILRHDQRQILWLGDRPPNGLRGNSSKRLAGSMRQSISFAIVIGPMAKSLPDAFARWAYVTGQRRRDRHGRMDMLNG
jgi:hypothetical protein